MKLAAFVCLLSVPAFSSDRLLNLSDDVEQLTRKVAPAVVKVLVTGYGPVSQENDGKTAAAIGLQHAIGSGVIVDPNGFIVTNAHVIDGAQRVQVVIPPARPGANPTASLAHGRMLRATIVGQDKTSDLAVLKVEATGLPTLPIGDYRKLRQGQVVLAFGSPEGLDDSVTMGVVSSVARQVDPDQPTIFIQTDAAVNPGNSGGPLVDVQGNLVGINTFILSGSGGSQGINFAIPSVVVRFVYGEILAHGHVHRRVLGLRLQALSPTLAAGLGLGDQRGLLVADVVPSGPAAVAGVQVRDILLALDDSSLDSLPDYEAALYRAPRGQPVTIDLLRGPQKLRVTVPVAEQQQRDINDLIGLADPAKNLVRQLGIIGLDLNDKIAALVEDLRIPTGVLVVAKAAGTMVDSGLEPGDIIHTVGNTQVNSLADLRKAIEAPKPGDPVALQIERSGDLQYLAFELD